VSYNLGQLTICLGLGLECMKLKYKLLLNFGFAKEGGYKILSNYKILICKT
jgi:hypothetical protein